MGEYKYIFGPVQSRRLGESLGVDLVPRKTCSFNCVYCQVGRTEKHTLIRREYVPFDEISSEIKHRLSNGVDADYITFSGNGEPTLNSKLGELIEYVKTLTEIPIAVITNASLMLNADVRNELSNADLIVPTLSTTTQEKFEQIHRPEPGTLVIDNIVGLIKFRKVFKGKIWLEVPIIPGVNDDEYSLGMLALAIGTIGPDKVQVHSIDRPPAETWVTPVDEQTLRAIVEKHFLNGEVVLPKICPSIRPKAQMSFQTNTADGLDIADKIIGIAKHRPVTSSDFAATAGIPVEEAKRNLEQLVAEGKLESRQEQGDVYYTATTG